MGGGGNSQTKRLPTISDLRRLLETRTRGLAKGKCASVLLIKEESRNFQLPSGKLDFHAGLVTEVSLSPPTGSL